MRSRNGLAQLSGRPPKRPFQSFTSLSTLIGDGECNGPGRPYAPLTEAVVRVTATGGTLVGITPPHPYGTFVGVTAAADNRTFVLAAQDLARLPLLAAPATRFFVLRIDDAQLDTGARPVPEGPVGQPVSAATDRQRHPLCPAPLSAPATSATTRASSATNASRRFPDPTAPSQPPGNTKPPGS